jgi:hypothetical protein
VAFHRINNLRVINTPNSSTPPPPPLLTCVISITYKIAACPCENRHASLRPPASSSGGGIANDSARIQAESTLFLLERKRPAEDRCRRLAAELLSALQASGVGQARRITQAVLASFHGSKSGAVRLAFDTSHCLLDPKRQSKSREEIYLRLILPPGTSTTSSQSE